MTLTANEYQNKALATAIYPGSGTFTGLAYVSLGLGEAGEFQGKVKKVLRDDNGVVTPERRKDLLKELGDIQWYVAAAAKELGASLDEVMSSNIQKLSGRADRGVLKGSGDDR